MQAAGYSGTPLSRKLGIKQGYVIRLINEPEYYLNLFADFPDEVTIINDKKIKKHCIHFFVKEKKQLLKEIVALKNEILQDGMIWVSWPKKSSKVITDINEDFIRETALNNGLVDIKVCAVDEVWSGLKLVIPVKERKQ